MKFIHSFNRVFLYLSQALLLFACANIAMPGGGDYDLDPPKVKRTSPPDKALNVNSRKIEIILDELVQLDKPNEKIIIAPPQKNLPVIQAISNKVSVQLRDTLIPNTTYTIDFTDAIQDYNERNALESFSLSFSTGDHLDSLEISGKVLNAANLEPVQGIYVGLHSNLEDTAFQKLPFDRISRTNDRGAFTMRGIAEGKYHLFALNDGNRNYIYDNKSEEIAFLDTLLIPSFLPATKTDTIFSNDSARIDSVVTTAYTRFMPDDIVLLSFSASFNRYFLSKKERPSDKVINLIFSSPTKLPEITPLNFSPDSTWYLLERNFTNDSLTYWITDQSLWKQDTLSLALTYIKSDSLDNPVLTTDTLYLSPRSKIKSQSEEEAAKPLLTMKTNLSSGMDIDIEPLIVFDRPVLSPEVSLFRFQQKHDSLYIDLPVSLEKDSLNPRLYRFGYEWQPGVEYRLKVDSAAFVSFDGEWNDSLITTFKLKTEEQYATLHLTIQGLNEQQTAFVELLDGSDKPFAQSQVKNGVATFVHIKPGKCYARLIMDSNANNKWDPGDYEQHLQPEKVYYCDKAWDLKANWEANETWNIAALPVDKQKPLEITKNKPQERQTKKAQLEREAQQRNSKQQQGNQSTTSPSLPAGLNRLTGR